MSLLVKIIDGQKNKVYSIADRGNAKLYIEDLFLRMETADIKDISTAETFLKENHYDFDIVTDPNIAAYGMIPYVYDIRNKTLYRNGEQASKEGTEYIGKIKYLFSGEIMYYSDMESFFNTITEDSDIYSPNEFYYSAISLDPKIRKVTDDYYYGSFGEDNPRSFEEYKQTDLNDLIMNRERTLRAEEIYKMLFERRYADFKDFPWIKNAVISDENKAVAQMKELYNMVSVLADTQDIDLQNLISVTFHDNPIFQTK